MDQALICKSLLYRSLVSLPKLDSIIDSVCITHKSSPNLSNLQITYSSVAGWFIETLILPCSCCSRRIQRMKGKFSSSSSLPRRIIMPQWSASLACRNYFNSFFVFQKTPWNQHLSNPTHWNLTPSSLFGKKLVPRKQGLMAWTLKKEKGSCRVRGCWRRRKELCVSGTDRRLGLHSFAVAQEWGQTSDVTTHGNQVQCSLKPWPSLV